MIFVSLGTNKNPFPRILKELENLINILNIKEEIIVQHGYTNYKSKYFSGFSIINMKKFIYYIERSDIIILHAGVGTLFNAIRNEKKIIAIARLKIFNEHKDDHQLEITKKLSKDGYILDGTYSLLNAWKKLDVFVPRKFDFSNKITENLKIYIDKL